MTLSCTLMPAENCETGFSPAAGLVLLSELEDHIDQQFKTYSSGMQARLTFATAISAESDIFIVDEALSVGDAAFQRKCFARMQELRAKDTTILLVSHDTNTIAFFCNTAVLMDKGHIVLSGDTKTVTNVYYESIYEKTRRQQQVEAPSSEAPSASARPKGFGTARIVDAGILNLNNEPVVILTSGQNYLFFIQAEFMQTKEQPLWGVCIQNSRGVLLYGNDSRMLVAKPAPCEKGETRTVCFKLHVHLASGSYFFMSGIGSIAGVTHAANVAGVRFEVVSDERCHNYGYLSMNAEFSDNIALHEQGV